MRSGARRASLADRTKRTREREGTDTRVQTQLCERSVRPANEGSTELGGINRSLTLPSRHRSENDIPPRRTDTKTALIVLEMMAHVQLS